MLSYNLASLAAILFLMLPIMIESFGRRGSSEPQQHKHHESHWSSTGMNGLDHETHEKEANKIKEVKRVKTTNTKSLQDIDHPDRQFMEHHPYASGVFTIDPTLGIS